MTPPRRGVRPRNNRRVEGRMRRSVTNRTPSVQGQAEDEIEFIRRQAGELRGNIDNLLARINRMEKGDSPAMVAVVDQQHCIGCGLCLEACSYDAITVKGVSSIDPIKCTGCGNCLNFCRKGAISLRPA